MSEDTIRKLTEDYVAAFNAGDIDAAAALMSETFSLTDPGVTNLTPKAKVVEFVSGLFDNAGDKLSFLAKNIIVEGDMSVIEFDIQLGDIIGTGTDVIRWDNGKMAEMRAYLTIKG